MNIQIPGFSSGDQARGLQNFITDIRNCTSREAEQQRIDKELANIRSKFAGSSSLTPYQVRDCVWTGGGCGNLIAGVLGIG
jgi:AP-2 complex subunit alpha